MGPGLRRQAAGLGHCKLADKRHAGMEGSLDDPPWSLVYRRGRGNDREMGVSDRRVRRTDAVCTCGDSTNYISMKSILNTNPSLT